ncbi:uncharacterized protein LOC108253428 [Diaphorina citri]|uniref:Uncharacterized protein LOC108253428 n=1 Tax=Diaphorina citri TaxID=121845 RepID=A0A1S4EL12_DIACI|nr:uncharacterized protein LOC108253428 [Diaphorina citri]
MTIHPTSNPASASYIPKCKADDPQLEKCILDGVEKVRPHLANGIREINVPPVEPFAIDKLQVDRNNNNLKMKLVLTHMKAYGCSTFKINTFKSDHGMKLREHDTNQECLTDLQNINKELKDALRFFNDNREQVYELALPIVEETGREIVLNIGNNVLKAIPIQDVVA